jgi:hypothetical protein
MYEENTPVNISEFTPPPLLGIAPNGQEEYELLTGVRGLSLSTTNILVDVTCVFTTACPPGQVDDSIVGLRIVAVSSGTAPPTIDYFRDVFTQSYTGIAEGMTTWVTGVVGILVPQYNPSNIRLVLQRTGGNPAVTVNLTKVYTKYKVLN